MATKLVGGGGKALGAGPLIFFVAFLSSLCSSVRKSIGLQLKLSININETLWIETIS